MLGALNRCGSLILFWKEEALGSIRHDEGYGFYAFIPDENISRLGLPFFLKEDERYPDPGPLSVNEDITASIKEHGGGRYQLLENNDLYFSATDGDPEAHEYSIVSPVIIRNRHLLILFAMVPLACLIHLVLFRDTGDPGPFKNLVRLLTAACFLMLLLPWNRMTFPGAPRGSGPFLFKPILQRNAVLIGLLFALLVLYFLMNSKAGALGIISILIVLSNTVYYFVPEWNYFGQRADSAAYIREYSASSIRTPGYPYFIKAVYRLTGNDGLEAVRAEGETLPDESLQDGRAVSSRGLLNVVRAQKCVLAVVFLILFGIFCRYYSPAWFAFAAQVMLCGGFLGVDNSYIMTECLSQAMILAAAAMCLMTVKEKKALPFLFLCLASAAGILIRPANIFLVIPILICFLWLLFKKQKILLPLLACVAFLALCALPAITIFREYGIFVWMPSSGYVEIARAVELLQPGDEAAFEDPELRGFCSDLLELKQQYPDADQNTNMWQVGVAAAEARGYDRITCSPLFGKVSRRIFMMHFREFTASLLGTVKTALERTRLRFGPVPFPGLVLLFTILFAVRIRTDSVLGMGFMGLHAVHLCISMVNQPERRYIYSTEIFCLLGWLLILINLMKKDRSTSP